MLRLQPWSPAQVIPASGREQQHSRWVVLVDGSLKGWVDALHESWMRQLCHWASADRAYAWKCPVWSKMAESDGGDFTSNHPQNRWGRSVRTVEWLCGSCANPGSAAPQITGNVEDVWPTWARTACTVWHAFVTRSHVFRGGSAEVRGAPGVVGLEVTACPMMVIV